MPLTLKDVRLDSVYDPNTRRHLVRVGVFFDNTHKVVVLNDGMTPKQVAAALLDLATQLETLE